MGYFSRSAAPDVDAMLSATITEIGSSQVGLLFGDVYLANIYSKILHECADRSTLPAELGEDIFQRTCYDSYTPSKKGLVSIMVAAMVSCKHIYVRKETITDGVIIFHTVERSTIDTTELPADVIEFDFREFYEAKVLKLLFALLSTVLQTISNGVTVSGGLLLKMHALSEMIENSQNKKAVLEQIASINAGLTQGKGSFIDAQSEVEFPSFDSKPAEASASFLFSLISSLTGLPNSYLFGEVVSGLGNGDNGDTRRMNAAIKRYFHNIWQGAAHAVFDRVLQYKNIVDDLQQLVSVFAFIETTTLLTDDGKRNFIRNNTSINEGDIAIGKDIPT